MPSLSRCLLLLALLILAAFFAMSESSFSYCSKIKVKVSLDEGKKSAKHVLKYLDNFDKFIILSLICSNIVILLFSVLSTTTVIKMIKEIPNISETSADEYGAIIATVLSTLIIFFFGEIIPKAIGKKFSNTICNISVYPYMVLDVIFTPISLFYRGLAVLLKKIFKVKESEATIEEDDFQDIVDSIEEKGLLEEQESYIIQSAVEIDDMKVKEVMCPREKICALDIEKHMSNDELIDFILDKPYSRIPIYRHDIDHIVGILHTQKLLKALMIHKDSDYEKLLAEPIFVSPNVHIDTIFEEFRKKKTHIAVVKGKDEKTIGIVTMEDVLEELVGDIDESKEVRKV